MSATGREANGSFQISSAVRTPTLAVVKHMIDDTPSPGFCRNTPTFSHNDQQTVSLRKNARQPAGGDCRICWSDTLSRLSADAIRSTEPSSHLLPRFVAPLVGRYGMSCLCRPVYGYFETSASYTERAAGLDILRLGKAFRYVTTRLRTSTGV